MTTVLIEPSSAADRRLLAIHLPPSFQMTDDEFFEFCRLNRDLRIERTAQGEILIMPPTGGMTGNRNARLTMQLVLWADSDGRGEVFDSSTGFRLPNGAERSPDLSWVRRSRLENLSEEEKKKFLPLCPDFVIELRSSTDRLTDLQQKMAEYIDNGAQLGWLIDPDQQRVHIYRPDAEVEILDQATEVTGELGVSTFTLDLGRIWRPGL